jgi:hypothetical protein
MQSLQTEHDLGQQSQLALNINELIPQLTPVIGAFDALFFFFFFEGTVTMPS